jgi:MarR family transcriptional regulator, organic hydroperoxide resistance regulator
VGIKHDLQREAEAITDHLRAIRLVLKRPVAEAIAESGLTAPQVGALRALADGGLSLKELSARLGLAHSTVSGIVDRLERRGFLRREPDARDRRRTIIVPSEVVRTYVRSATALHRPESLVQALRRASAEDRSTIMAGLMTLRTLLEQDQTT